MNPMSETNTRTSGYLDLGDERTAIIIEHTKKKKYYAILAIGVISLASVSVLVALTVSKTQNTTYKDTSGESYATLASLSPTLSPTPDIYGNDEKSDGIETVAPTASVGVSGYEVTGWLGDVVLPSSSSTKNTKQPETQSLDEITVVPIPQTEDWSTTKTGSEDQSAHNTTNKEKNSSNKTEEANSSPYSIATSYALFSSRETNILNVLSEVSSPQALTLYPLFFSAQRKATEWILHEDPLQVDLRDSSTSAQSHTTPISKEKIIQRYVLALLYFSVEMDISTSSFDEMSAGVYLSGVDECLWMHITCNERGYVNTISLNNTNLTGTLPDELYHLTYLQKMDFKENYLKGSIPTTYGNLSRLYYLDVSHNALTGEAIPEEFLAEKSPLEYLFLSDNTFTGTLSRNIENMDKLRYLWIDDNSLQGGIPRTLGFVETLESVVLHTNSFSGTVPKSMGKLRRATYIDLSNNNLQGSLTRSIFDATSNRYLYLNSNNLTGTIPRVPSSIGTNSSLVHLWLDDNKFEGEIPDTLARLTNLESLRLQSNSLEGKVPYGLCALREVKLEFLEVDCSIECEENCCTWCI